VGAMIRQILVGMGGAAIFIGGIALLNALVQWQKRRKG
jgi:hypothetical protein